MGKKNKQAKWTEQDVKSDEDVTPEEQAVAAAPETPTIDFDGWYAMRKHRIPAHHRKEILKVDFKARGVPVKTTLAEFDAALKKYGVTLA